jgi:hypothetical protein
MFNHAHSYFLFSFGILDSLIDLIPPLPREWRCQAEVQFLEYVNLDLRHYLKASWALFVLLLYTTRVNSLQYIHMHAAWCLFWCSQCFLAGWCECVCDVLLRL